MNRWGQLGVAPNTGTYGTSENSSSTAVWAAGITNATSIVTGDQHTCAILSDTSVKCWGFNGSGEMGANSSDSSDYLPAAVVVDTANTKLTGVTQLATSYNHTCALSSTHQVNCWGDNSYGQLGIPYATASESNVAIKATALLNSIGSLTVSAISAGEYYTCALLSDKSVRCWGEGTSGELGNALAQDSEAPVTVALSTATPRATVVGSGYGHSCAVLDNTAQSIQCWGANGYGQIGNDSNTDAVTPADVLTDTAATLTGAGQISVGGDHTCALASGGLYCWGNNGYGQLGRNDTTLSTTAVRVLGL
jgi:alpha-tubulin suppressor-like RCC1 family protein